MHGRVKVRSTEEQEALKELERQKKCKGYLVLRNALFAKRNAQVHDRDGLQLSEQILLLNPDFTTVFAYRRETLLALLASDEPVDWAAEREFTTACLKRNPKSYNCWHHRRWILNQEAEPQAEAELELCTLFLKHDERNFHCWDYRRFVVEKLDRHDAVATELAYTEDKISHNYSNYSAWHNRSNLLLQFHGVTEPAQLATEALDAELELLTNAFYIDPQDQSAWYYHRWLLGRAPTVPHVIASAVAGEALHIVTNLPTRLEPKALRATFGTAEVALQPERTGLAIKHVLRWSAAADGAQQPSHLLLDSGALTTVDGATSTGSTIELNASVADRTDISLQRWSQPPGNADAVASQLDLIKELMAELEVGESKWCRLRLMEMLWQESALKHAATIREHLTELQAIDPTRHMFYASMLRRLRASEIFYEAPAIFEVDEAEAEPASDWWHVLSGCTKVCLARPRASLKGLELLVLCSELDVVGAADGNTADADALLGMPHLKILVVGKGFSDAAASTVASLRARDVQVVIKE